MRRSRTTRRRRGRTVPVAGRKGAGSLDYVLVLGVILPIVTLGMTAGRRIVQLVYEMLVVFIAWPFL